jgi:hypothetical protein
MNTGTTGKNVCAVHTRHNHSWQGAQNLPELQTTSRFQDIACGKRSQKWLRRSGAAESCVRLAVLRYDAETLHTAVHGTDPEQTIHLKTRFRADWDCSKSMHTINSPATCRDIHWHDEQEVNLANTHRRFLGKQPNHNITSVSKAANIITNASIRRFERVLHFYNRRRVCWSRPSQCRYV